MTKKILLLTTLILNSSLYSDTTTLKNGKVYKNAKVFHKGDTVIVSFECGKQIVFNKSEISETEIKPLTRWKTQEECNQTEEEAKQAAEKRKEEEARRREEKRLREEQRRQELALKKQDCEAKGDLWNGKDCKKKSVTPVIPNKKEATAPGKWSDYLGEMNWKDAKADCASLGMRLPTREELVAAHKAGAWIKWQKEAHPHEHSAYWTSEKYSAENTYSVHIGSGYITKDRYYSYVRCIR